MADQVPSRSRGEQEVRADLVGRPGMLPAQQYIHTEGLGGGLLLLSALVALVWANTPWADGYFALREAPITLDLGVYRIEQSALKWINDGLMTLFFLVVGLEVKREFVSGELSTWKRAALPVIAAGAGMVLPAAIYATVNLWGDGRPSGWGVPMATDVAFALGVLALMGERVQAKLRVFLLALTVIDDIGSILVIAGFYSHDISWTALGLAAALLAVLVGMRRLGVQNVMLVVLVAVPFWAAVHASGVHATIAGVLLGLITPSRRLVDRDQFREGLDRLSEEYEEALDSDEPERADLVLGRIEELTRETESPLDRVERLTHPWSSFLVLPLFALANAGVALNRGLLVEASASPITWGIVAGLLLGKGLGIFGASWAAVKSGVAELPTGIRLPQIGALSLLAGIGFTVSLFIAGLAFGGSGGEGGAGGGATLPLAKVGILGASLAAGLGGIVALWFTGGQNAKEETEEAGVSRPETQADDDRSGEVSEVAAARRED